MRIVLAIGLGVLVSLASCSSSDDNKTGDGGNNTNTNNTNTNTNNTNTNNTATDGGSNTTKTLTPVIETMDDVTCCNSQIDIQIGPDGTPIIAGPREGKIWLASLSGDTWLEEEVIDHGLTRFTFAVGGDGSFHLINAVDKELMYIHKKDAGWETIRVDADDSVATHYDITVDSSNKPHVTFLNTTTKGLMYASFNGSGFDVEEVDIPTAEGDQRGEYATLAVGSDGKVHISYLAIVDGTHALRYAVGPGEWKVTDVEGDAKGVYGSILLDSKGNPQIVSTNLISKRAKGVFWSSLKDDKWTETEIVEGTAIVDLDATIDSKDMIHLITAENVAMGYGPWVYHFYDGAKFERVVKPKPPSPDGAGFAPGPSPPPKSVAIAVDENDMAHIAIPRSYIHF